MRKISLFGFLAILLLANPALALQLDFAVGPFFLDSSSFSLGNDVTNFASAITPDAKVDLDGTGFALDMAATIPVQFLGHNAVRVGYEYWNVEDTTRGFQREQTPAGTYFSIMPIDPAAERPISFFNAIDSGKFSYESLSHTATIYAMRQYAPAGFELNFGYGLTFGYNESEMHFELAGIDISTPVFERDRFRLETKRIGLGLMAAGRKPLPAGFSVALGLEARLFLGWQEAFGRQEQTGGSYGNALNRAKESNNGVLMPEVIIKLEGAKSLPYGFALFLSGDARYLGNMPEMAMPRQDLDGISAASTFDLDKTDMWGYRILAGVRRNF